MAHTYKGVSGLDGAVGGERGWVARGGLYFLLGLFIGAMSQRSTSYRPKQA